MLCEHRVVRTDGWINSGLALSRVSIAKELESKRVGVIWQHTMRTVWIMKQVKQGYLRLGREG